MSYELALGAAGAEVLEFQSFGSYQGDWWAYVRYKKKHGWVTGSFGSCSVCDAFEAEFGWSDNEKPDYEKRMKAFGLTYLDPLLTQEEAEMEATRNLDWDHEAKEMLEFIKKTGKKYVNV